MRRTKEDALITREQLLDSALQIFLKKGYSSTSIMDIVNEAGFTRGAYYWHFKSKEELLDKMLEREDVFVNKLITDLFEADLAPLEKIEHIMLGIITNFYENIRFRKFIEFTWFKIEQSFDHKSIIYKASLSNLVIEKLNECINEAIQLNQIDKSVTPNSIALHLISLINGIYRLFFISPNYFEEKEASLELVRNYLSLIKNKKEN